MGIHIKDIAGEQFGYLTAIEFDHRDKRKTYWKFRCKCGKEVIRATSRLYEAKTPSCGCYSLELIEEARERREQREKEKAEKMRYKHKSARNNRDLTGEKWGFLNVLQRVGELDSVNTEYLCECVCGKRTVKKQKYIITSAKASCGCFGRVQGEVKENRERLKRIYNGMIQRCYNQKAEAYKYYGAKGISIYKLWLEDGGFEKFMEWSLNNGYAKDLTIDRIDPYGNYTPQNCRWADCETQANNRTDNVKIEYNGEVLTMVQFSRKYNLNYGRVGDIIKKDCIFSGDYLIQKMGVN